MVGWHHQLDGLESDKLRELVMDGEAWRATVHGVAKSWTRLSDWTEQEKMCTASPIRNWLHQQLSQWEIFVTLNSHFFPIYFHWKQALSASSFFSIKQHCSRFVIGFACGFYYSLFVPTAIPQLFLNKPVFAGEITILSLRSTSLIFIEHLLWAINFFLFGFLAVLGLHCCVQTFSSCGEQVLFFVAVWGLLILVASFVAEPRFQGLGFSSCGTQA